MQNAGHIFISYSHRDIDWMRKIRDEITNNGLTVWMDENLKPGTEDWKQAIESALCNAYAVVVISSTAAKYSKWVRREIGFAQDIGCPIFPVVINGNTRSAIFFELANHQYVDLRGLNDLSSAASYHDFINELKRKAQDIIYYSEQNISNAKSKNLQEKNVPYDDPFLWMYMTPIMVANAVIWAIKGWEYGSSLVNSALLEYLLGGLGVLFGGFLGATIGSLIPTILIAFIPIVIISLLVGVELEELDINQQRIIYFLATPIALLWYLGKFWLLIKYGNQALLSDWWLCGCNIALLIAAGVRLGKREFAKTQTSA